MLNPDYLISGTGVRARMANGQGATRSGFSCIRAGRETVRSGEGPAREGIGGEDRSRHFGRQASYYVLAGAVLVFLNTAGRLLRSPGL